MSIAKTFRPLDPTTHTPQHWRALVRSCQRMPGPHFRQVEQVYSDCAVLSQTHGLATIEMLARVEEDGELIPMPEARQVSDGEWTYPGKDGLRQRITVSRDPSPGMRRKRNRAKGLTLVMVRTEVMVTLNRSGGPCWVHKPGTEFSVIGEI